MPNNTPGTATVISALPYSTSQVLNPMDDAWYTLTAAHDATISVFGFGDLTTYAPYNFVYSPTSATFYLSLSDFPRANVPLQFPVEAGVQYWFQFTPSVPVANGTLTVSAQEASTTTAPAGSILINDDAAGFSAAILSSVDGDDENVIKFVKDIATGDGGDVLSQSQKILLANDPTGEMVQYSPDLSSVLTTLSFNGGGGAGKVWIRANQTTQTYYAGQHNAAIHPAFKKITADGVMTSFTTLSANGLQAFAVSDDETIIYLANNAFNSALKRWDVTGSAFLTDLAAGVLTFTISDILLMGDGTILAMYHNSTDVYVNQYDSAGTVLNTYTLETGQVLPSVSLGYRLAFAIDDPTSFWVWYHISDGGTSQDGISRIKNVLVSDGSILSSVEYVEFENGTYRASPAADPIARFGPSSSCPFIILRTGSSPPGPGIPEEFLIRRERWFPVISQEQQRLFFQKLQVDLQAGNGLTTGQGSDPLMEIDWSDDGGFTWSNVRFRRSGPLGQYQRRVIERMLGQSRSRVFRLAVSDPVQWIIVDGYMDLLAGGN